MRRPVLGAVGCLSVFLWWGCAAKSDKTAAVPVSVSVVPTTASVAMGKTQQFTGTVRGTSNSMVTWSVAGGASNGAISNSGLYTAPATAPNASVKVTATAQADATKSASATVTVTTSAAAASSSVTVSPSAATVANFGTQQFTASV